jgi:cholesterol transport system auxiliary component
MISQGLTAKRLMVASLGLVLMLGLSGCITLFPKTKPVQLYRFGVQTMASVDEQPKAFIAILKGPTLFNRAASGDRILTITGRQSAYIADARWFDSASVLFDASLTNSFAQSKGGARLIRSGDGASATLNLRLDVRAFEVRYNARGRKPVAAVNVQGLLVDADSRVIIAQNLFDCEQGADANRVRDLVEALDTAVSDCQAKIVTWTNATLESRAKP